MPTLTINATAEQLQRVQDALGLNSGAEVKQWVIDTIKQAVKGAELAKLNETEQAKVDAAQTNMQTAINAKVQEPDVELI